MRMRLRALALLLFSTLLAGCSFDHPLTDGPSDDINTWLLGVWEHTDDEGKIYRAAVIPLTGDRFTIWFRVLGKKPQATKEWQFEAWISRVGRSSFLSLQCKKSAGEVAEEAFVFAHYQLIDQNNLILRTLQLDSTPDTTSFKLRAEVRAKLKDKTLYPEKGSAWTRISEVYWDLGNNAEQPRQPLRFPLPGSEGDPSAIKKPLSVPPAQ